MVVNGQIVGGNNNVLHLHNDHLVSNSVMSYSSNGNEVIGSRARYLPYGGWRTTPTQGFTERATRGTCTMTTASAACKGLIYMNAR